MKNTDKSGDYVKTLATEKNPPPTSSAQVIKIVKLLQGEEMYGAIHPAMFNGGHQLIRVAESNELAFGDNNRRMSFGRMHVFRAFCEVFSPILISLAENSRTIRGELETEELMPMYKQLDDYSKATGYAQRLRACAGGISRVHQLHARDEADRRFLLGVAEGFVFMADILGGILPQVAIDQWCPCCFRRAHPDLTYCNLHRDSKGWSAQNTENRKAKREFKHLPESLLKRWQRNRSLRLIDPKKINFISGDELPSAGGCFDVLLTAEQAVAIRGMNLFWSDNANENANDNPNPNPKPKPNHNHNHKALYRDDVWRKAWGNENGWGGINDWPEIAAWGQIIDELPAVKARLQGNLPSQCLSWTDFVTRLYRALEDDAQKMTFPFYVLTYIREAEEYFQYVASQPSDRRRNGTLEKVEAAAKAGKSPQQIAEEMGVGLKYVRRLLRSIS